MTNDQQPMMNGTPQHDEIEINIADIIDFVKKNWKKAMLSAVAFGLVGVVFALSSQNEFESKTSLMPELQGSGSKLGGLSALAGLAGIEVGGAGGTEAVRPDLYPNILQSTTFVLYLLQQTVYSHEYKEKMTVEQYFDKKNQGIIEKIFGKSGKKESDLLDPKNESKTLELTKKYESLVKDLNTRVVASVDKKSLIITVSSKMPDPVVAASTVKIAVDYLKEYVTNYRTDKSRKQVKFLANQVAEAKARYQNAEIAVAGYKDRNRFLIMNTAKVEEQRLIADFMLAQTVYNELSKQFEQSKIRVEEETPVFKVLDPAKIPLQKSEPKRSIMVLSFAVLGVVLCFAYIFAKQLFGKYF
jgi:uncharacterized protein involved in exopolysaccharide biosynthesis